jgi:hypothetical protein
MRTPQTKRRHLVLATHFIAVTLWVECYRLLPQVPRERRIAFVTGSAAACHGVPDRDHARLRLARQSAAALGRRDPAADAAGVPALDRAQLPQISDMLALVLGLRCIRWSPCCTPASTS